MSQPDYQHPTPTRSAATTTETISTASLTPANADHETPITPTGSAPMTSRGLLIAAWVAASALAVLALVAVVWTIELVRLQLELQAAARSIRDYIAHLGGAFGTGSSTQCPNGEPFC